MSNKERGRETEGKWWNLWDKFTGLWFRVLWLITTPTLPCLTHTFVGLQGNARITERHSYMVLIMRLDLFSPRAPSFTQANTQAQAKILGTTSRHYDASKKYIYINNHAVVIVVQPLNCVWLFSTPWTVACQTDSSVLHCLPEFAQIHVHWIINNDICLLKIVQKSSFYKCEKKKQEAFKRTY